MSEMIVSLEKVCGKKIYTRDDGHVLYDAITEALKSYDKVIIQFDNKEIASESFLDEAIVEHYLRPKQNSIVERLILRNVTKFDQILLKKIFEYRKRLEDKERKNNLKNSKK